ncbi:MAG: prephenate dehydrogenase/arogenate dehydrogenase family protein [Planctomycetes bacterium]|nr:prephenate dehydrogenase/arogenate dehydrogenase family protein [Planctomycetota bacterium]
MRKLRQITVIGLGLLGSSITLAVSRKIPSTKVAGYSHRASTRAKARKLRVADKVYDNLAESVAEADIVILATPIGVFEEIFEEIAQLLPVGCIVTDVGSTKVMPHCWAKKAFGRDICYVGSHPIAGSERRGVEFGKADLFNDALCILTGDKNTNPAAVKVLRGLWTKLGCIVKEITPAEHDRILGNVSHLPHIMAASLINASNDKYLKFAGPGFIDTSRIASAPANIWADIFMTNSVNLCKAIDREIKEMLRLKAAISRQDKKQIERLLEKARDRRGRLVGCKANNKNLE